MQDSVEATPAQQAARQQQGGRGLGGRDRRPRQMITIPTNSDCRAHLLVCTRTQTNVAGGLGSEKLNEPLLEIVDERGVRGLI